jgi:hypothetical protein
MLDLAPKPGDLEPIETASRDELVSLQLERLPRKAVVMDLAARVLA